MGGGYVELIVQVIDVCDSKLREAAFSGLKQLRHVRDIVADKVKYKVSMSLTI